SSTVRLFSVPLGTEIVRALPHAGHLTSTCTAVSSGSPKCPTSRRAPQEQRCCSRRRSAGGFIWKVSDIRPPGQRPPYRQRNVDRKKKTARGRTPGRLLRSD